MFIGSKEGYDGRIFAREELIEKVRQFQKQMDMVSVRITPTTYLAGDYVEDGWEIAAINYPRFPKDPTAFMKNLAIYLISELKQNRISIMTANETFLFESDSAQQNPGDKKAK